MNVWVAGILVLLIVLLGAWIIGFPPGAGFFLSIPAIAIIYFLANKRKPEGTIKKNATVAKPAQEPSNSEILQKIEMIEKRIGDVQSDVKRLDNRIKDISSWFWPIVIGGLIGWFWDDIIGFVKSLFSAG